MFSMRGRRYVIVGICLAIITLLLLADSPRRSQARDYFDSFLENKPWFKEKPPPGPGPPPAPKYIPEPTWVPPPVKDPFPRLSSSEAVPLIPKWNVPKKDLHKQYGLEYAPPLFIGFTRSWPILLQAVVSYITAGWPAGQIYVIENTGVQSDDLSELQAMIPPTLLPTLAGMSASQAGLVFVLIHLSGDPTQGFMPPGAAPELREATRERLGLNDPLIEQYGRFVWNGLSGDFGVSWRDNQPALQSVLDRLPSTLVLARVMQIKKYLSLPNVLVLL